MNVLALRLTLAICLTALCAVTGSACGHASPSPAAQRSASAPSTARPSSAVRPLDGAPSRSEVVRAIRSLAARRDPSFTVTKVVDIEIARGPRGGWWVRADAVPHAAAGVETPTIVAVERRGRWRLAGYGTNLGSDAALRQMRLPSPVARQLFPHTGLWAGYYVTGRHLKSVTATWVEPNSTVVGTGFRSASFWVGLGGWNGDGLSQIGTSADTQGGSVASFYAYPWYEMYPKPPVTDLWVHVATGRQQMSTSMGAGDTITAAVVFLGGGRFRLTLVDETQGARFTTVRRRADPGFASAEIIVEGYSHAGRDLLAAFSGLRFTDCRVNGRPLGAWRPGKTEIVSGPSGRYLTSTSQLGSGGTSFSVARQ